MVTLIGIISTVVVVLIYDCIFLRWRERRRLGPPSSSREERSRLGNSIIQMIPAYKYRKEAQINGCESECAVCLCEFEEGDEVRLLPECLHSFHAPCIDMWLFSHSNCPLCRTHLVPPPILQPVVAPESGGLRNLVA
ncbi:RING-H2 finger protein ATL51-like [Magnolia sinica]|uniref:RING-H2 finger protein ATL51-like n=1 Tax=Magnolia sinica TaxID=86752 RepID=UPI00265A4599|nr:RING-H2 finger protein ATL51-like [Magnolia sinica]